MSRAVLKSFLAIAALAAWLGAPAQAHADDYMTIIVDYSGSMADLSDSMHTKTVVAKTLADNYLTAPASNRHYAVWLFYNNGSTPGFYEKIVDFHDNLDGNAAAAKLDMRLSTVPPGDNLTPLAASMCAALFDLEATAVLKTDTRHLYTISDGLENSSPSDPDPTKDCSGFQSVGKFTLDPNVPANGLDANSWEWKVRNVAVTGAANNASDPPNPKVQIDVAFLDQWIPTAPLLAKSANFVTLDHQASTPLVSITSAKFTANVAVPAPDDLVAFYAGLTKITGGSFSQIGGVENLVLPINGDLDSSGCVDAKDAVILAHSLGHKVPAGTPADINHDGKVDGQDMRILAHNINQGPNCPCNKK